MKKLIAAVLALSMFISSVAFADLKEEAMKLSVDELLQVNAAVQNALFSKTATVDGVPVPPGVYKGGEDIPAGSYRIEIQNIEKVIYGNIKIQNELPWKFEMYDFGVNQDTTSIGKTTIDDGDTVNISGCTAVFYTYTGLFH